MADDLKTVRHLLASTLICVDAAITHRGEEAAHDARSAAWRIADAGLVLRGLMEEESIPGLGVTELTGRGAMLSCGTR